MTELTHNDLCLLAVKWLRRSFSQGGHGCHLALSEPSTYGECPDAIGFRHGNNHAGSVVIEVKISRNDFLADFKKPHRADGQGMGKWRYYMCPEGLISVDELPTCWGLIYVKPNGRFKVMAGAASCPTKPNLPYYESLDNPFWHFDNDWKNEQGILIRWLARIKNPDQVALMIREANNALQRQIARNEKLQQRNHKLETENFNLRNKDV